MIPVVALIVFGLCLLALEMVFPSWGVLTVAAILCIAGALQLAYAIDGGTGFWTLISLVLTMPAALLLGCWAAQYSPIVLRGEPVAPAVDQADLSGAIGRVVAPLRPTGSIQLEGHALPLSAVSEARLPRDAVVEVVGRRGGDLLVRELRDVSGVQGA